MFDRIMKLMARWYFRNMHQPAAIADGVANRAASRHVADQLRLAAAAERAAGHLFLAPTTGTAA